VRCIKDGITVKKAHDSTLSSLTVSQNKWWIGSGYEFSWDAPISPIFSKSTLSYQDTVENNIRAVKVAATSLDPENLITYEGGVVSTAATTNFGEQELSIVEGSTSTMKVRVTNANGNSLTYTVNVFRKALLPTSQIPWQSGISYGSVKDASGQSYKTVQIGMQTWMAENFNYAGPYGATGVCYNNNPDSCSNFGRLYSWAEVMNGSSSSNTSPSRVQGICPTGWHVPSDSEWTTLLKFVDTANSTSGTKLKSLKGWGYSNPGFNGDGVDAYGFRALPSGSRYQFACYDAGHYGNWWSATENKAWFMRYSEYKVLGPMTLAIEHSVSLRCIKDGMQ
jgi:uncharacterized protein (TIGR02145 family)